jgi:protein-disulfide isomerase
MPSMRALVVCLVCLLSACAAPKPVAHAPAAREEEAGPAKFPLSQRKELSGGVERIYEIPSTPEAPVLGGGDAKVTLEVCSDFQCPYCAQLAPTLHELHENYEELVRIVWRNCPLPFHEHAQPAAEAAVEVHKQRGSPAFWAYHDLLFAHQYELSLDALVGLAGQIEGVDSSQVRAALGDHRHAAHVRDELLAVVDAGAAANGFGTPATFINGRLLAGAQPYQSFEDAVERALQELPEARARAIEASKQSYPMARVRHILVQFQGAREAHAKRSREEAQQKAQLLRTQVTPSSFEQYARSESDCPSRQDGGELGRFTVGELEQSIELALFALEPGQVSEVIESPFGFHILLREE